MGAKLPEDEVGVLVGFKYPRKKARKLDKLAKTYGFKNKSKFVYWAVELGKQILAGDPQSVETIFSHFQRPEDPRQQELFDAVVVEAKAQTWTRMSQAMQEAPEALQEVVQSHLSSQK